MRKKTSGKAQEMTSDGLPKSYATILGGTRALPLPVLHRLMQVKAYVVCLAHKAAKWRMEVSPANPTTGNPH